MQNFATLSTIFFNTTLCAVHGMISGESIFGAQRDIFFMEQALAQARKALAHDEVPVGAVVVDAHGNIIARAYNAVEKQCSQRAHAESLALARAGKKCNNWRLDGHWLYVTLQPCIMCMGLIRLSRLDGVLYAAPSPLFGSGLDLELPSAVYKREIALIGGILQDEATVLLKEFFQTKRKGRE